MRGSAPIWAARAYIAALPLCSHAAFEQRIYEIGRVSSSTLDKPTEKLWSAGLPEIEPLVGRIDRNELALIRDSLWFNGEHRRSMWQYTAALASKLLAFDGDVVRPTLEYEGKMARAVQRWRWYSLALPPTVLLAALAVAAKRPLIHHVTLLPLAVQRMLQEQPVAEQHVHLGAATTFDAFWDDATAWRDEPLDKASEWPGKAEMLAARLLRAILETHVQHPGRPLEATLAHVIERQKARRAMSEAELLRGLRCAGGSLRLPGRASSNPALELRHFLRRLAPINEPAARNAAVARHGAAAPHAHAALLHALFTQLAADEASLARAEAPWRAVDHSTLGWSLAPVVWQYVRCYTGVYRRIVQSPTGKGLDWFSKFYKSIGAYKRTPRTRAEMTKKTVNNLRRAVATNGHGVTLQALEFRREPERTWNEVFREVKGVLDELARSCGAEADRRQRPPREGVRATASESQLFPELGLTYHFLKDVPAKSAGAGQVRGGFRYAGWYKPAARRAQALSQMLRLYPRGFALVCALDIANLELEIPTWVVLPLFLHVRKVAETATHHRALRATPHVGEHFRHLAEGLRRIYEAMTCGLVRQGDRLGHALALGTCVHTWQQAHVVVWQPREERFFDVVWMLTMVRQHQLPCSYPLGAALEQEALKHWRDMGGDDLLTRVGVSQGATVAMLCEAYELLLDEQGIIKRLGYLEAAPRPLTKPHELIARLFLTSPGLFRRGQLPVSVESSTEELTLLGLAQAKVWEQVGALGLTIEVNPSSNMLIGGYDSMREHPVFALQPWAAANHDSLPVSLSTDDPIVFATTLADEYAYCYHAMREAGACDEQARAWIRRVAEYGWWSRFTSTAPRRR